MAAIVPVKFFCFECMDTMAGIITDLGQSFEELVDNGTFERMPEYERPLGVCCYRCWSYDKELVFRSPALQVKRMGVQNDDKDSPSA